MKYLFLSCLCLAMFGACQPAATVDSEASKSTSAPKSVPVNKDGLQMNPKHPNIPLAELGITVVNVDGWTTQQMEFHLDYCNQMMGSLEDLDPDSFCECFLSKIQYYYEPRFFKEAYQDQQAWNRMCYEQAQQ